MSVSIDKLKAVFLAALEKTTAAERAAFLDEACAGDAALRHGVEELLRAHDRADPLLDRPASEHLEPSSARPAPDDLLGFLGAPSRPDSLGRLEHYEVLEVLGRGGFGIVLRAFDDTLQRVVAVKVLAPQLAVTSPARKRFLREARASAKVRHENVVQVHAVGEQPLPYLVMEFIPGETLQQRVDRIGPLETPEVVQIGRQIALGLAAAHGMGLIHRDIKPENILLEAGPHPRVKITDFGLARAADDASLTQSGMVAGSPLYMSPEQVSGDTLDHRSDLFSLGSVLYTMASGRPPFRAANTLAVLKRVAEDTPRPIPEIIPEVPPWLCDLIARLHAKKPQERFATAQELADLLTGHLARLPPSGQVPPIWDAAPTLEKVPAGQTSQAATSRLPLSPGETGRGEGRPRSRTRRWVAAALLLLAVGGLGVTEATGVSDVRGTMIRLFAPEGTVVVEVEDPGVSVRIDGAELVITGAGAREIRLKPGQYAVEASKDGKVIRRELVSVTRNGRQVVRVSQEQAQGVKADGRSEWERSVASLPAHEQVAAVAARLKERNPDFDGALPHRIEGGLVTAVVVGKNVVDLSPLRALPGLKSVELDQPFGQRAVSDLSPLTGLSLTALSIRFTHVSDLAPLKGMPLTALNIELASGLTDLSPIKGMKLTALTCGATQVSDLSPLAGMPLKSLKFVDCPMADLSPLKGNTTLTTLEIWMTGVSDLSPLKGLPLTALNIGRTGVTDLAPLKGMPLTSLIVPDSMVSDLTPLTGLPLTTLHCGHSRVADLSPIKGMKLTSLNCSATKVSDLSPLKDMPLKTLTCDFVAARDAGVLRGLRTLETINDKPAAEFWKAVDAPPGD